MKVLIIVLLAFFSASQANAASIYLRSETGAPWGQSNNEASMDGVFGGDWEDLRYETVNVNTLFSEDTDFIFMEGGDRTADELESFISANQTGMENWVANGGRLFINSAPNEGNGMSYGFGVSLNYQGYVAAGHRTAMAVDPSHDIFNGPFGATGSNFTGTFFSHATGAGVELNNLIVNGASESVLSDMFWGKGYVMFGGLTTLNFQRPNSFELRQNILHYAANVQTVPEPSSLLGLLGIGVLSIAGRKRSKTQTNVKL